jgi:type I restriction enzyme M protein
MTWECDVHTLLRLPIGIWYSPGLKANVLFFDKKPLSTNSTTNEVWVYDLRSNKNFSLRNNPIRSSDLTDFIQCYSANDRSARKTSEHFRRFKYADIMDRDKASLDIQWQQEAGKPSNGSTPRVLMRGILADLEEAMKEFAAAEEEIQR